MIPDNIKREHILAALVEIDKHGIPPGREATKFALFHDQKTYPPKYVVCAAGKYATGTPLDPKSFNGGNETNTFLMARGFKVAAIRAGVAPPVEHLRAMRTTLPTNPKPYKRSKHNERCPDCKHAIKSLLEAIYGKAEMNPRIEASTNPEDYKNSSLYSSLNRIYGLLQEYRGHKNFGRSSAMPNCDFWVPNPGFLLEFDESQHFTECRALALENYPSDITFGFDKELWLSYCRTICASDHDPPFRDEQRAWYDTLRDFVPHWKGFHPTLRLFASEFEWCSLKPENGKDVETFRQILADRANFWKLEFSDAAFPQLARVVIDGPWRGDVPIARKLLENICDQWPKGKRIRCLTTCGAFLRFDWPIGIQNQVDNRFPDQEAMRILDQEGRNSCNELFTSTLVEKLGACTDYITLGIDTFKNKISTTQAHIPEPHAELVYFTDLSNGNSHFTAKSYPTPGQEKGLLRNARLENHFWELNGNKVMVLGCHDLTMFNPRSDATATGWRSDVKKEFKRLAVEYQPRWVLHHPHTAVKKLTWLAAWSGLKQALPSVESYVGSGAYSRKDFGWNGRNSLTEVLASTKSADVMDIIVHMASP
jgi:hypothetical protein